MNRNRIVFYVKKQTCAFMSGLLFLLSVTGMTTVKAETAENDLTSRKHQAMDWVESISENMLIDTEDYIPNATCNAMTVLRREGREIDSLWLQEWEEECFEFNTDELAHLVWAHDNADDLKELWDYQQDDGGFGLTEEYGSDLYDTILAVAAVAVLSGSISDNTMPVSEDQLENAVKYIASCQNEDGGFGYTLADTSRKDISAETGIVLLELGIDNETCYEALDIYCKEAFQSSFTEENFKEQAKLARYLYKRGIIEDSEKIENELVSLQDENGSVYNNLSDTLEYILLLNEIQDYHSLKLTVHEFTCESDTYVLEVGEEQAVSIQTALKYKINQPAEAVIRYTICEGGKKKTVQENICRLLPDETQHKDSCELLILPEEGHEYTICIELLTKEENKPYARYEIAYNLHKTEYEELILTSERGEEGSSEIMLSWNDISNEDERYAYRLFQRKGENEWETRSTWDGTEKVKVLNVYPVKEAESYLQQWMEETLDECEEPAGKGLFEIDSVLIEDYNKKPDAILLDGKGNYKYDVLMFGTYDSNDYKDLSDASYEATKKFIDSGRGVLFGHDTVVSWMNHFSKFADPLGVKLKSGYTKRLSTEVRVVKEGFLTGYPWKLSGTLIIPETHTQAQFTGGTMSAEVWMELASGYDTDEETGAKTNAYLFSKNQLAMIQTGHSNGQATDDERKILANTLFYLKQLTSRTSATDKSVTDEEKPIITSVTTVSDNGNVLIRAEDCGTEYQYYVEAVGESEESKVRKSNVVREEAVTGIKGFILCVNDEETPIGTMAEYGEDGRLTSEITEAKEGQLLYDTSLLNPGESAWLHICAVDHAGNVSDEFVQKIEHTKKTEERTYFDLPYALYASEGEVQLFCCEANIDGDIYGKNTFRFQGSAIHLNGRAVSPESLSIAGGVLDIKERAEYAPEEVLPDYMDLIVKDMEDAEMAENISAYNSTDILVPTRCATTTGAWCNNVQLGASLISEERISFNANTITCGDTEEVVLASETGDIHMQATKISGNGLIYAPNGTVTINVSQFDYTGTIVAKEIKIQAGYYNQNQ